MRSIFYETPSPLHLNDYQSDSTKVFVTAFINTGFRCHHQQRLDHHSFTSPVNLAPAWKKKPGRPERAWQSRISPSSKVSVSRPQVGDGEAPADITISTQRWRALAARVRRRRRSLTLNLPVTRMQSSVKFFNESECRAQCQRLRLAPG